MSKDIIIQNAKDSFETLKYVLEVKLGDILNSVDYKYIRPELNLTDIDLMDCEAMLSIVLDYNHFDLETIGDKLLHLDGVIKDVLDSYFMTIMGRLTKKPTQQIQMGFMWMVHEIKTDMSNHNIDIDILINLYDM